VPETFKSTDAKALKNVPDYMFTVQIAPEDCTGCGLCVEMCPGKSKENPDHKAIMMESQAPLREPEVVNYEFFLNIPEPEKELMPRTTVKGSQFYRPLFEYSGACAGCGETPYVKLLSQLFGDRAYIANATGCSSIYGGNLPTTPYTKRKDGRGPVWSNSLFEDNAEFGMGMRLTIDKHTEFARELIEECLKSDCCADFADLLKEVRDADQSTQDLLEEQRARIAQLKPKLSACDCTACKQLLSLADYLAVKSGSSAETAGRMISVTAVSTMSWPPAGMSMCSCSTRKCIQTPAVKCRKPLPSARLRNLPRPANRCPRKTWA